MRFALDATDTPHLLYSAFNCKVEGLKYARLEGDTWQTAVVYSKPSPSEEEMMRRFGCRNYSLGLMVSASNDLAVDSNGGVHVVYADPESEQVVYGYRPQGAEDWKWESLENVGNHRLTVSRINPVVRIGPAGEVRVLYKRYTRGETAAGANTVLIELRLATRTERGWKCRTVVDRLGFIDGRSEILFGEARESLVAYTRCAASGYGDPSVKWILAQLDGEGRGVRYEGEPREQLLTCAWLGDRLNMVMTRVRPERPADGTVLQDSLVQLSAGSDWQWTAKDLLELKNRRALDAASDRYGRVHVLLASTSEESSTLEHGVLEDVGLTRRQDDEPDG